MYHMKPFISSLFALLLLAGVSLTAQEKFERTPYTLTHHMSPEEKAQFHLVGKGFEATDPPPGEVHNIAEFEKMEGVLIAFPNNFGISYDLIAALSEETMVTTIVETTSAQNYVTGQYQSHGVNMENVNFLIAELNSYWTRDYGPWYVRYGDHQIGIVDFIYNRPNRPDDNAIPPQVADFLGIEWFAMDLIATGGNYMTDGYGVSSSSDLIYQENPTLSPEEIDQMVLDYLGVTEYHVVPDPNNTYIDHIDCWGKFLDVDKVLIRAVPESHPQYDEIEATAQYYADQTTSWGVPFQVYRVWTPNNEPYTNSLILNDRVFVPITGSQWDDDAIATYQEAMPGYEVMGFTGSWESTDALHCRTKGIADRNTLYIEHFPLLGNQPVQSEYPIEAKVIPYSGNPVVDDQVVVHYLIDDVAQPDITMTPAGNEVYTAVLPGGQTGAKISYYITAADAGGFSASHPFIGEPDPHVFYVGEQLFPDMSLDITEINALVNQGEISTNTFNISNQGQYPLSWEIEASSAFLEDFTYEVEDSPAPYAWDDNTFTELGWTTFEVDNTVGTLAGWTISFTWDTDQYPTESTFYAESPEGTQAVIAAGIADGEYTIQLDAFNGEQMQGEWKLWITDSYGDGGHQATNISIVMTKTYTIVEWLSANPLSGTVEPGSSEQVIVTCDATYMPLGDYTGHLYLSSNDPESPEVDIPVYLTVASLSGLSDKNSRNELLIGPNPFNQRIFFTGEIIDESTVLSIYSSNGQLIKQINNSGNLNTIEWDGTDNSGQKAVDGVYIYRIAGYDFEESGKIILKR
ncbi:MAG: hypothetical protein Kow00127_17760 [Bacteroidales bacterium]